MGLPVKSSEIQGPRGLIPGDVISIERTPYSVTVVFDHGVTIVAHPLPWYRRIPWALRNFWRAQWKR